MLLMPTSNRRNLLAEIKDLEPLLRDRRRIYGRRLLNSFRYLAVGICSDMIDAMVVDTSRLKSSWRVTRNPSVYLPYKWHVKGQRGSTSIISGQIAKKVARRDAPFYIRNAFEPRFAVGNSTPYTLAPAGRRWYPNYMRNVARIAFFRYWNRVRGITGRIPAGPTVH